jgi:hypothetical protein
MSDQAFPIITVHDLMATRRFYEQLGFAQVYQFPACDLVRSRLLTTLRQAPGEGALSQATEISPLTD